MKITFSMLLITVLLLIYPKGIAGHECEPSDCIHRRLCPALVDKVKAVIEASTRDLYTKLMNFLPTIQCSDNGHICCSKMSLLDFKSEFIIENHPNIGLLPESCGPLKFNRIFMPVEQNYPWLVMIAYDNYFNCVGTLINDRYVLTSAQCVKDKAVQGVRLGESDIRQCQPQRTPRYFNVHQMDCDNIESQDVEVETVIIHEGYSLGHDNDIALLRLNRAANFSKSNIAPICLPKTSSMLLKNMTETIVEIISDWKLDDGDFAHSSDVPITFACTIRKAGDMDCKDSGGFRCKSYSGNPLMVQSDIGNSHTYVQYGILVDGHFRCSLDRLKKYTDVTKYMKWILDSIRP